ncbi:hypothetical protein J4471_00530 [Candidatus Woesearchaeota archaeon]|nr:hypothetical protein [Candidatus Woesearchaeota archaeon]
MNFIKKLFENKIDGSVHLQFERYSKGIFEDKALIEIDKTKKNLKIKTSYEFAKEFVSLLALKIKDTAHISGVVITNNKEFKDKVKFPIADVSQFAGIKKFQIAADISQDDLLNALKQFPNALFLLTFNTDYGNLTTKQKLPKSAKPGADKAAKADFCTFKTEDISFAKEFLFDYDKDFSKVKIKHTFIIEELVIPKEFANDPAKARVNAKRKGKIKRFIEVDGITFEKEIKFEA